MNCILWLLFDCYLCQNINYYTAKYAQIVSNFKTSSLLSNCINNSNIRVQLHFIMAIIYINSDNYHSVKQCVIYCYVAMFHIFLFMPDFSAHLRNYICRRIQVAEKSNEMPNIARSG